MMYTRNEDGKMIEVEDLSKEMQEVMNDLGGALSQQVGGDHYAKLGKYQPVMVLKRWLTEEEFRGYMKGTAIVYLARERDKGGDEDLKKCGHTLDLFMEVRDET